ncbi:TetR/AcrR family transcriptional regulator [Lysobacter sp. M2-1]|uniref:TetR/AcrR family transcriptional regulator n=2 Tax=unclassified Lysobacter TaxID=2635362 RepID=UPI001F56C2B6|nr:TetR/AcrR family transcriptional regulator [Lysobacter sp. M2-1]
MPWDTAGMGQAPHDLDPRRRRTRESLQSAFTLLAQQRRYHEIRIDDILKASGVSRSTFYEHFAGKDALLAASMDGALSLLADLPAGKASVPQVAALLAHFWDNRALARSLLQGAALRVIRSALMRQVEDRLKLAGSARLRLPRRLAAHALADGMFSPIVAWLSGEAASSPADLAAALATSSQAMLGGMRTVLHLRQ